MTKEPYIDLVLGDCVDVIYEVEVAISEELIGRFTTPKCATVN